MPTQVPSFVRKIVSSKFVQTVWKWKTSILVIIGVVWGLILMFTSIPMIQGSKESSKWDATHFRPRPTLTATPEVVPQRFAELFPDKDCIRWGDVTWYADHHEGDWFVNRGEFALTEYYHHYGKGVKAFALKVHTFDSCIQEDASETDWWAGKR